MPGGRPIDAVVKSRASGDWQASKSDGDSRATPVGTFWILVDFTVRPTEFMIVPTHEIKWIIAADIVDWSSRNDGPTERGHTRITTESVAEWRNRWDLLEMDNGSENAGYPSVGRADRRDGGLIATKEPDLLFRCVLEVTETVELLAVVDTQVSTWAEELGLVLAVGLTEAPISLGHGYTGSRMERPDSTGGRSTRTILTTNTKTWSVTTASPDGAEAPGFILIDLRGSAGDTPTGVPSMIPRLLDSLQVLDAGRPVRAAAAVVGPDDLEDLAAAIAEEGRRGLVQISVAPAGLTAAEWRERMQAVVDNTAGLARSFVLGHEAAAALARVMGASHQVPPGWIRCYGPGAVAGNHDDARRHSFISSNRLDDDPSQVRRDLARHARLLALQIPLPPRLVQVGSLFGDEAFPTSRPQPQEGPDQASPSKSKAPQSPEVAFAAASSEKEGESPVPDNMADRLADLEVELAAARERIDALESAAGDAADAAEHGQWRDRADRVRSSISGLRPPRLRPSWRRK